MEDMFIRVADRWVKLNPVTGQPLSNLPALPFKIKILGVKLNSHILLQLENGHNIFIRSTDSTFVQLEVPRTLEENSLQVSLLIDSPGLGLQSFSLKLEKINTYRALIVTPNSTPWKEPKPDVGFSGVSGPVKIAEHPSARDAYRKNNRFK